ncbi:MAG: ABC transporter substrate-binding protein [Dehalococcoidia bacterium]|nr:ABC transporter substrate-binding protein [Dehalococcoidia bacterium]
MSLFLHTRRRRRRFIPFACVALLTLLGAALIGCGANDDEEPTETATSAVETTVTGTATSGTSTSTATPTPSGDGLRDVTLMLNWTPNAQHAGIYLALANGWYEEQGINLEVVEPAAAGADQVVGTGGAEFGVSQAESLLPARAAGVPVVSIATIMPYNDSSFMSLASAGIERPRDFEGKTYGGYGGALETELLHTLVACDGGDPDKVNMVEVGNIDYLAGMEQGRFDFVWVFEGWDALRARDVEGKDINSIKFVDWLDCIPDWYTPIFITSEDMIANDPELVRAFLAATARGYEAAISDPAAATDALLAAAPELDQSLVAASVQYHAPKFVGEGGWGTQDAEVWSAFADFLVTAGLLDQPIDSDAAFTNEFLP